MQLGLKVNIDLHGTENVLKKRYTCSKEVSYEKGIENPNLEATSPFYRLYNRFCNRYCYTDTAFHATENILNNIIKAEEFSKLFFGASVLKCNCFSKHALLWKRKRLTKKAAVDYMQLDRHKCKGNNERHVETTVEWYRQQYYDTIDSVISSI